MRIKLTKRERTYLRWGILTSIDRLIGHANSTVNGRKANPRHDARQWLDGWRSLGVNDKRTYVDGSGSCGEYLHCPLLGDAKERRWYRVRSRIEPGYLLHFGRAKRHCTHVLARRGNDGWQWTYLFVAPQEPRE